MNKMCFCLFTLMLFASCNVNKDVHTGVEKSAKEDLPKVGDDCKGEANPDMICPAVFDPVCGCDGNTYPNDCVATSSGVKKYTSGECNE